jgi:hypothetical protein
MEYNHEPMVNLGNVGSDLAHTARQFAHGSSGGRYSRFAAKSGVVKEVEYELAPESPRVELGREMPANVSYARPVRVVIKV